jgi:hypothetical protein
VAFVFPGYSLSDENICNGEEERVEREEGGGSGEGYCWGGGER